MVDYAGASERLLRPGQPESRRRHPLCRLHAHRCAQPGPDWRGRFYLLLGASARNQLVGEVLNLCRTFERSCRGAGSLIASRTRRGRPRAPVTTLTSACQRRGSHGKSQPLLFSVTADHFRHWLALARWLRRYAAQPESRNLSISGTRPGYGRRYRPATTTWVRQDIRAQLATW